MTNIQTETNTETSIETLTASVTRLVPIADAAKAAQLEEDEAEAELVATIIATSLPAIRHCAVRIRLSAGSSGGGTDRQREDVPTYYPTRGVYLGTGRAGPEEDAPRDNQGAYVGVDEFLLTDGSFARVEYSGSWSRWQGAGQSWEGELTRREWGQTRVSLDTLLERLSAAVGTLAGRESATKAATARAAHLRAIIALIAK